MIKRREEVESEFGLQFDILGSGQLRDPIFAYKVGRL